MTRYLYATIFCIAVWMLVLEIGTSNPVPEQGSGRTLTMYLTVDSDSGTAVRPMKGGRVAFRCDIQDYHEAAHVVTWTRFEPTTVSWVELASAGTLQPSANQRMLVSRVQASNSSRKGNVHQVLVIDPVQESDRGLYRCNVKETLASNTTGCAVEVVASRELALTVFTAEIFPVCFPSTKALDPLVPGDILACGTLTKARIPLVTKRGNTAGEQEGWPKGPRRDGRPGWELTKKVNATDDGVEYDCWSVPTDFATADFALSCAITPRVMKATKPTPAEALSVGAIIGIAVGAGVVVVVVLVACCICCCKSS